MTGDKVATVIMDPARVRQMLVNLIGNALKFTQRGGVFIRVDLQRENNLEDDERGISFAVTDTGIGIPAEKLETIFDSFSQLSDDVSPTYGGTGLGLAITRRLVGVLGGEIQVESTPGEGTTFRLHWITRVDEQVSHPAHGMRATSLGIPDLKGKTILAVDDNPINLRLVVHFIQPTKAKILTAEDGREALALMREYLPDLVLMDMRMPHLDGYEATRQAKSDPAIAAIPIVAVTASAMKEDKNRILEAGCDEYLAKPVTREILFEMLMRFLLSGEVDESAQSETSPEENKTPDTGNEWLRMISQAVTKEYTPQLDELLRKNDLPGLRRFGHTMKGLGRQFQLDSLAQWGESFEKSAETLTPDALREYAAGFDAIAKEITTLCRNGQDEKATEGEVAPSLDKE